ncbi:MAG TPA: hypothetical protein VFO07_04125, partial [Roseiflexaceae bacterium]|nr:hypothetical protein [Roseiflexaceae bacterium]
MLALLAIMLLSLVMPAGILAEPTDPLQIVASADGISLSWRLPSNSFSDLDAQFALPGVEIGGARLPAKLLAIRLPESLPATPQIDRMESLPWAGAIRSADSLIPQTMTGERRPALAARSAATLPASPVVVLREARMRGARIVVLAISPLFSVGGQPRVVTQLEATMRGATPLAEGAAQLLTSTAPFLASAPSPTNPAATVGSVRVRVTHPGIQRMT